MNDHFHQHITASSASAEIGPQQIIDKEKEERRCLVDPKILFDRWFDQAIKQLEKLDDGDGGTAGMMIAIPLFERYVQILASRAGKHGLDFQIMGDLLEVSAKEAERFWNIFRHGFCHTGMPNNDSCKVSLSDRFGASPRFHLASNGDEVVGLDPWKFIRYVMDVYRGDPSLLTGLPKAPLLAIYTFG